MIPDSDCCPLCGGGFIECFESRAHDSITEGGTVAIRLCHKCEFAWQWPINRTVEESKKYFLAEYEAERKESYFDKARRSQIASLQVDFLNELPIESKSILDIGCGDGAFVFESAKQGWISTGLDPAMPDTINIGAAITNPKFVQGTLDALDHDKKYDCVTLWDVVEHLPDPKNMLEKAWEFVLPGGWMVMETGNYQSSERVLAGSNWWGWQHDHRWYFSPSTLEKILQPLEYSEKRLAKSALRPWINENWKIKAPSKAQTILSIMKRPWRLSAIMSEHATKRESISRWPDWAGLPIFTLAIRK